MAIYSIEDKTLTALGDAVRNKILGQIDPPVITDEVSIDYGTAKPFQFGPAVSKVKIIGHVDWNYNGAWKHTLAISKGYYTGGYDAYIANTKIKTFSNIEPYDFEIELDGNAFTFHTDAYSNGPAAIKLNYTVIGLDENGKAFRYSPTEMANVINNLTVLSDSNFTFTGDLSYLNQKGRWDWYFTNFADKIVMKDVSSLNYAFKDSKLSVFPEINWSITMGIMSNAFEGTPITDIPIVNNGIFSSIGSVFSNCAYLVHIPDDFWTDCQAQDTASLASMFQNCQRLRNLPIGFINRLINNQSVYSNALYNLAYGCYSLDEIVGINLSNATFTSNGCNGIVRNTYHLKDLIFAVNEDGSPLVRQWKSQTIDLSSYVGYGSLSSSYGFEDNVRITNDENYQTLKDNPDAWTTDYKYSRYNHDSAVRTINSLPDTSAYGTNTIKFEGKSGSLTDSGAINTLTAEEIAVAAAKGWTVSLV